VRKYTIKNNIIQSQTFLHVDTLVISESAAYET